MSDPRRCQWCGEDLVGKRLHAEYCDSSCRGKATHWRQSRSGEQEKALESASPPPIQAIREEQEAAKAHWSMIVREGIIEVLKTTGAYHADDLDHLGIPDEHRNIIGSQTAKLVNQKWIEEAGRRKSILPRTERSRAYTDSLRSVNESSSETAQVEVEPPRAPALFRARPGRLVPEAVLVWRLRKDRRGTLTLRAPASQSPTNRSSEQGKEGTLGPVRPTRPRGPSPARARAQQRCPDKRKHRGGPLRIRPLPAPLLSRPVFQGLRKAPRREGSVMPHEAHPRSQRMRIPRVPEVSV